MNRNLNQIETYLRWYSQRGPAVFGDWKWLTTKYLPAIRKFELKRDRVSDKVLISDSYYKIGDIFFFMNAPLESIKYFKLSIKHDPEHAGAYREVGDRLIEIGEYEEAKTFLLKANKLWPEDQDTKNSLDDIEEYKSNPDDSLLFQKGNKTWVNDEFLSQGKFNKVLKNLKGSKNILGHQQRARAYGGLNEKNEMIKEWEEISKIEGPIKMQSSDWFYMPYSVWNDTKYWLALSKLKNRFEHGNYPYHESLWEIVVPKAKIKKNYKEPDLKLHNKRVNLFIQFQIARTSKDKNLSNKLYEKYPDWPELKALYERLKSS